MAPMNAATVVSFAREPKFSFNPLTPIWAFVYILYNNDRTGFMLGLILVAAEVLAVAGRPGDATPVVDISECFAFAIYIVSC